MGTIRVTVVDHDDNGTTYVRRVRVTRPHSLRSHHRVGANVARSLNLDGHRLTITTNGSDD